jgi:Holliday junction resolvase
MAVAKFLRAKGWKVVSTCNEQTRGDDIVAKKGRKEIRIEAKGEGSSKDSTKRYGNTFKREQVLTHVAAAFYRAAAMAQENDCLIGMAFPENEHHRIYVGRIQKKLSELGFLVFWVSPEKTVRVEPKSRKF